MRLVAKLSTKHVWAESTEGEVLEREEGDWTDVAGGLLGQVGNDPSLLGGQWQSFQSRFNPLNDLNKVPVAGTFGSKPGLIWHDAQPHSTETSSHVINAFGADGPGVGGSVQWNADSVSSGFAYSTGRARLGMSWGGGFGAVASAGELKGGQWASKGFCN